MFHIGSGIGRCQQCEEDRKIAFIAWHDSNPEAMRWAETKEILGCLKV